MGDRPRQFLAQIAISVDIDEGKVRIGQPALLILP
jgi:hypothetical protein